MELDPKTADRLKKIALSATALVVGGAIVKYVNEQDKPQGYVYYIKESGSTFVGLLKREGGILAQFTGKMFEKDGSNTFEPDTTELPEPIIAQFEEVFNPETKIQT